jgi:Flp pilus assembly pilin Flp
LLAALIDALVPSPGLPRQAGTGKTQGVVHVHSLIEKYTKETEAAASEEGVTMVEYAIMASGVALVLGVAFLAVTGSVQRAFNAVAAAIP